MLQSFILALITFFSFSVMAQSNSVDGYWLTENERAVIQIEQCDKGPCGKIYWIVEGGMQYDTQNPDEALQDRKLCGLEILSSFRKTANNEWSDGKIYKADDGDTYNANMTLVDDNRLRLRGYVGIPLFGKTQMWNRVDAANYSKCD